MLISKIGFHSAQKNEAYGNNTSKINSYRNNLNTDTVSFTGVKTTKILDHFEKGYIADIPRLERLSTQYQDMLEVIANKLQRLGVTFDRNYNSKSPIKSAASVCSKLSREGSVRDKVRATLFVKNPYYLKLLSSHFLPEMEKRGFVLAKDPVTKVPDLSIRLKPNEKYIVPDELKPFLSKPPKSGYEDIQMRFVRQQDPKKEKTLHELIIVFNEGYAKAKTNESKYAYDILKELKDLSMLKSGSENDVPNKYLKNIKDHTEIIGRTLRTKISIPLFANAKNAHFNTTKEVLPVGIKRHHRILMHGSLNELRLRDIPKFYAEQKAAALKEADPAIREELLKNIEILQKEDVQKIMNAEKLFKKTLEKYSLDD